MKKKNNLGTVINKYTGYYDKVKNKLEENENQRYSEQQELSPNLNNLRCPSCDSPIQKEWRICPFCKIFLKEEISYYREKDFDLEDIEKEIREKNHFIKKLKKRVVNGEISETTYLDLKKEYENDIISLNNALEKIKRLDEEKKKVKSEIESKISIKKRDNNIEKVIYKEYNKSELLKYNDSLEVEKAKKYGNWGIVVAIIGLFFFGFIFGIIALVLGFKAGSKASRGLIAVIIGIFDIIVWILLLMIGA